MFRAFLFLFFQFWQKENLCFRVPQIMKFHKECSCLTNATWNLLARIWHLTADCPQVLEAITDGMNVSHTHKHHFTVRIIFWKMSNRRRKLVGKLNQTYLSHEISSTIILFNENSSN